ncbi:hypothetical protein ACP4OV_010297 [Aristida adscensionis]
MWRRRLGDRLPRSALSPPSSTAASSPPHWRRSVLLPSEVTSRGCHPSAPCAFLRTPGGPRWEPSAQALHLSGGDADHPQKPFIAFVLVESILEIIKEGRIVPSEITVDLIRKAMETSNSKKVLIDGFPRCEENRIAFERIVGTEPDIVVFFDCPEDEMVKRLLGRNQGRVDDNIETIKKRLKVFESLNIPVVDYYSSRGKVHKINATGTADEIFDAVRQLFSSSADDQEMYYLFAVYDEAMVFEGNRPG